MLPTRSAPWRWHRRSPVPREARGLTDCSGTKHSLYATRCIEYSCVMTVLDTHPDDAFANDRAHVFHSWSAQATLNPLVVAGAEGSYFWTQDGTRYLDFSSQLINVNIGHQHPRLVAAIKEQADRLCTVAPFHANDARSEAARLICEV